MSLCADSGNKKRRQVFCRRFFLLGFEGGITRFALDVLRGNAFVGNARAGSPPSYADAPVARSYRLPVFKPISCDGFRPWRGMLSVGSMRRLEALPPMADAPVARPYWLVFMATMREGVMSEVGV